MKIQLAGAALLFIVALQTTAATAPQIAVDRGLPHVNLNDSSGIIRSNVRWSGEENGFVGDDFTIGAPGEKWVIDTIRTWAVPQISVTSPHQLGDLFLDVRLYFGPATGSLTPIIGAGFSENSSDTDNPNVTVTEMTQNGAVPYDDRGTSLEIWQIDFTNLNRVIEGGVKYGFGVWGMGRPVVGKEGRMQHWFNLASNAELGSSPQDSADGVLLLYDGGGQFEGTFDSKGSAWDKSSDLNVQVIAHRIDSPVSHPLR